MAPRMRPSATVMPMVPEGEPTTAPPKMARVIEAGAQKRRAGWRWSWWRRVRVVLRSPRARQHTRLAVLETEGGYESNARAAVVIATTRKILF